MIEQMFDLAQFAVPPEEYTLHDDPADNGPLSVRNPGNLEFIRVCADPAYRARVSVLTDDQTKESYIIANNIRQSLEGEAKPAYISLAMNQDGKPFLWLVKLPSYEGENWGESRVAAMNRAKNEWVRVRTRADRKGYETIPAANSYPDPQWPTAPFAELCREALAGKFISSVDHPVLRRMRGEA